MRSRTQPTRHRRSGFTLAELLASLLFLAIVIPAAVQALRVASLSGTVAARKGAAARIADRVLNESLVLTNWSNASQRGTTREGNDGLVGVDGADLVVTVSHVHNAAWAHCNTARTRVQRIYQSIPIA